MLHDPGNVMPIPVEEEIVLSDAEKDILRMLGAQVARIASLPVHQEKAELWRKLNDLRPERPMVWVNEIPWHEMNINGELALKCAHPWARQLEDSLRKTIYQWNHMPGDMIVDSFIECPLIYHSTDFGIIEDVETAFTDERNNIYSRKFHIQIKDMDDLPKIQMPVITFYPKATKFAYSALTDLFSDIIEVKKVGQKHIWFTPWDYLIRWWGVEEAMIDLAERPNMVHAFYERMVQAWMTELDQFEAQNLLALDCDNTRIGSGGYGYVSDLPGESFDPAHVRPKNMWGCSNAQIFASVSPAMHWEFALEHDLKWLARFGLTYYGCCEPLDNKLDFLRRIPNLRKFSVSAWCDVKRVVENVGRDYVLSHKPTPSVFIDYCAERAEADLTGYLDTARGCCSEIIMKDISTVQNKPQNLWEWTDIAMKAAMG